MHDSVDRSQLLEVVLLVLLVLLVYIEFIVKVIIQQVITLNCNCYPDELSIS